MRIRKEQEIGQDLNKEDVELIAAASDAFAHPVRIQIYRFIMKKNVSRENVSNKTLVEEFGYAQSTISQHMKKLTDSNLVEIKHEGKYAYYFANLGLFMKYINAVKNFPIGK